MMTAPALNQLDPGPEYRRNVGIMLLNAAGLAFVGQRGDTPEQAWQMPQGGIDAGETVLEAALRELGEEVGTSAAQVLLETEAWLTYDLPVDLAGKLWRGKWKGQAQKWVVLQFAGSDSDINIETEHPEFSAWRWVPRDQLTTLIIPFKQPVYKALLADVEPKLRDLGF